MTQRPPEELWKWVSVVASDSDYTGCEKTKWLWGQKAEHFGHYRMPTTITSAALLVPDRGHLRAKYLILSPITPREKLPSLVTSVLVHHYSIIVVYDLSAGTCLVLLNIPAGLVSYLCWLSELRFVAAWSLLCVLMLSRCYRLSILSAVTEEKIDKVRSTLTAVKRSPLPKQAWRLSDEYILTCWICFIYLFTFFVVSFYFLTNLTLNKHCCCLCLLSAHSCQCPWLRSQTQSVQSQMAYKCPDSLYPRQWVNWLIFDMTCLLLYFML